MSDVAPSPEFVTPDTEAPAGAAEDRCVKCGSDRVKITPSGRRYCIPCRHAHTKRRKARVRAEAR